jgi:tetratricopeptide (TPR) repeat protein
MGKKLLFAALGICLYLISFSQNNDALKDTFEEAEYYILYEDYPEALALFLDLHNMGLDNAYVKHRIGECYLQISGQKEKSIPFLEEACNNLSDDIKEGSIKETKAPYRTLFYLASAYQQNNELEKAIETFKKFEELIANNNDYNIDYVYKQIQSCNAAKDLISKPKEIQEINIGEYINDQFPNIRPVISADEKSMVYMSKLKFYDAIFYTVKQNDKWSAPINITPDLNSDGNVYPCFLSEDGKTLLLSKEENFRNDIYISYLKGNKWSAPVKLNKNINSRFQETFASLSCDGKTLFFVSNRKGGFGGTDIYKCIFDEKSKDWGEAINLGSEINTPFNEETPVMCQDNKTLYFSSEGHYNMGGFDIFYSENIEQNVWNKPTNMGYPVNTTDDNLFYYPVKDGQKAYISKYDKGGYGQEDIVKLELNTSAQR